MIKKRLFFSIDELRKDKFYEKIAPLNNKIDEDMIKHCGISINSYWGLIRAIRIKLQQHKILNEINYIKYDFAIAHLVLENMILPNKFKREKIINCFENIIKKEFNLNLKDLKPLNKNIFSVEPNLIKNLKGLSYFRY